MFEKYGPLPPAKDDDLKLEWESSKTGIWLTDVPGGFAVSYVDKVFMRKTLGQEEPTALHPKLSRKIARELKL